MLRNYAGVDSDRDGIPDKVEDGLLERFRPYYKFSMEHDPSDWSKYKHEPYPPTDPIWYIRHSELLDVAEQGASPVITNEALREDPLAILTACQIGANWGSSDIHCNMKKTSYYLNIFDEYRKGYKDGDGYDWPDIVSLGNVGLYGHVVPYGEYYKIEYYQFFGYSGVAWAGYDWGEHEADWEIALQLFYDPRTDQLIRTVHAFHGKEASFDLRLTRESAMLEGGAIREFRGPNYDTGSFTVGSYDGCTPSEQDPWKACNNLVRFYRDPVTGEYSHPVVYVEHGYHGCWPSEHWSYYGAPKHGGDSWSYLTSTPPNLGEVEYPSRGVEGADIILRYNGRWGAYGILTGKPPGPALHWEWIWPRNSVLRSLIPDDSFEDGSSIGHHWPALVNTLATLDFEHGDGLAVGDLNGDGSAEIIQGDRGDKIVVYNSIGDKICEFSQDFERADRLAAGDVDGDGRDEIVLGDRSNYIWIFDVDIRGTDNCIVGSFRFDRDFEAGDELAVGDFMGDNKAEIIFADRGDQIVIYSNRGEVLFRFGIDDFELGDRLTAGDVDGDGKEEIIMGDRSDLIRIFSYQSPPPGYRESSFERDFENIGDWCSSCCTDFAGTDWCSYWLCGDDEIAVNSDGIAAGDVDGDGKDEIIIADMSEDKIYIYDSAGHQEASFYCNFSRGDGLAVGNTEGDSKSELVHGDRDNYIRVFSLLSMSAQ